MVDSSGNKYTYWVFTIQAIKGSTLPGEQSVIRAMTLLSEKYVFQEQHPYIIKDAAKLESERDSRQS
jgi:hypothetical protein